MRAKNNPISQEQSSFEFESARSQVAWVVACSLIERFNAKWTTSASDSRKKLDRDWSSRNLHIHLVESPDANFDSPCWRAQETCKRNEIVC